MLIYYKQRFYRAISALFWRAFHSLKDFSQKQKQYITISFLSKQVLKILFLEVLLCENFKAGFHILFVVNIFISYNIIYIHWLINPF